MYCKVEKKNGVPEVLYGLREVADMHDVLCGTSVGIQDYTADSTVCVEGIWEIIFRIFDNIPRPILLAWKTECNSDFCKLEKLRYVLEGSARSL